MEFNLLNDLKVQQIYNELISGKYRVVKLEEIPNVTRIELKSGTNEELKVISKTYMKI